MAAILNQINRLAFVIAPVFWNLVYRSVIAVIVGYLWLAFSKAFDRYLHPGCKFGGIFLVFQILLMPFTFNEYSHMSVMKSFEPIQHISYRQEYDMYESYYFIAQQDDEASYMGIPDGALKDMADRRYAKSLVFDVALPLIWLGGTAAGGVLLVTANTSLKKKINRSSRPAEKWIYDIYEENKIILKTKKTADILITDIVSVPAVTGMFKKKILLPSYVETMDKTTVANILIHEQQHIKQGDVEYAYFIMAVQTVYWFNPLLTRLLKHQRQQIELITDYNVLNRTQQDTAYTTAMVDVLAHNATGVTGHPMLCMTDSVKNMKQRIQNIKHRDFYKKNFNKITICVSVLFCICWIFLAPTYDTYTPEQPAIYKDSHGALAVEKPSSISFGINDRHINISCSLPWNWESLGLRHTLVNEVPQSDVPLPLGMFEQTTYLMQDDELIGFIGLSSFEPYTEEIPQEEYHKTVWPQLRLSSFAIWDPFTPVKQTETGEIGLVDINYVDYEYYATHPDTPLADVPHYESFGIMGYNKEDGVYAAIAFLPDKVNRDTALEIARSLEVYGNNSYPEAEPHLGRWKQASVNINGYEFSCDLPAAWNITAEGGNTGRNGIPVPLGEYDEFEHTVNILNNSELIGRIGVNSFVPYEGEISPENYYQTVFSGLRTSSFFSWEPFETLIRTENGENGVVDIYYVDYLQLEYYPGAKAATPHHTTNGAWAYDRDAQFYVCFGFIPGTVTDEDAARIAQSIVLKTG
ncbi:MAG: M56 family metallopeptidase [Oscillospiraceae bacterium]|nr:M56 family metallopeptidase [Oscillospiraceae bacterium]